MTRRQRIAAGLVLAMVAGLILLAGLAFAEARETPVVRRAAMALPHWPVGARPITVALLADIHIGSAAMDAGRLDRIVAQVNALHPDLILIAGDFVFGHDRARGRTEAAQLAVPLSRLRAPLGTVAVLGNHDHWTAPAAIIDNLTRAGVTVVENDAIERGPVAIVGIGDAYSGHADPLRALARAMDLRGAPLGLTHAPDIARALPSGSLPLLLAGHTHCGQISPPMWRSMGSRTWPGRHFIFDPHYRCGIVRDPGRTVIVTAGLGTSGLPARLWAPPDLWLLRLGPDVSRLRP